MSAMGPGTSDFTTELWADNYSCARLDCFVGPGNILGLYSCGAAGRSKTCFDWMGGGRGAVIELYPRKYEDHPSNKQIHSWK